MYTARGKFSLKYTFDNSQRTILRRVGNDEIDCTSCTVCKYVLIVEIYSRQLNYRWTNLVRID